MVSMDWLLRHRQLKEAETDRLIPTDAGASSLLYPSFWIAKTSNHGYDRNLEIALLRGG